MEIEHPEIRPERRNMNNVIELFLSGFSIGACCTHVLACSGEDMIYIWSMHSKTNSELPEIEEIIFAVDHEFMHHLLFCIEGLWVTTAFDSILWDVDEWIHLFPH